MATNSHILSLHHSTRHSSVERCCVTALPRSFIAPEAGSKDILRFVIPSRRKLAPHGKSAIAKATSTKRSRSKQGIHKAPCSTSVRAKRTRNREHLRERYPVLISSAAIHQWK